MTQPIQYDIETGETEAGKFELTPSMKKEIGSKLKIKINRQFYATFEVNSTTKQIEENFNKISWSRSYTVNNFCT